MQPKKRKHIDVLGHRIKISYVEAIDSDDEDVLGLFTVNPYHIQVVDDERWHEHLLHEICHAILRISGTAELVDPVIEEAIVTALENGLNYLVLLR